MFEINTILIIVFIIWNIFTLSLMGIDKQRAIKHKRRISEKELFLAAFFLGGTGIMLGMYVFRHKTRHISFRILVPLAVLSNIILIILILKLI